MPRRFLHNGLYNKRRLISKACIDCYSISETERPHLRRQTNLSTEVRTVKSSLVYNYCIQGGTKLILYVEESYDSCYRRN